MAHGEIYEPAGFEESVLGNGYPNLFAVRLCLRLVPPIFQTPAEKAGWNKSN